MCVLVCVRACVLGEFALGWKGRWGVAQARMRVEVFVCGSRLLPDLPNLKFASSQVTRRGPPRLRPTHLSYRGPKSLTAARARVRVTRRGSTSR